MTQSSPSAFTRQSEVCFQETSFSFRSLGHLFFQLAEGGRHGRPRGARPQRELVRRALGGQLPKPGGEGVVRARTRASGYGNLRPLKVVENSGRELSEEARQGDDLRRRIKG